jgi:hypothetical protein
MEAELLQATTSAVRLTNPTENEPTGKTEREQRALDQELSPVGNGDSTRNLIEPLMPDLKAQHLSQKDEIWPVTEPTARGTLGWCALSKDRIKIQRRMRGNQNRLGERLKNRDKGNQDSSCGHQKQSRRKNQRRIHSSQEKQEHIFQLKSNTIRTPRRSPPSLSHLIGTKI